MPTPPQNQAEGQPPVMAEDAQPAAPAASPQDDQAQTVEVPASAIGAAKEGDTVQFKVVSVDQQNGIANLAPMPASEPESAGGTDGMADEFKPQPKGM
jgi:hypothetical protein